RKAEERARAAGSSSSQQSASSQPASEQPPQETPREEVPPEEVPQEEVPSEEPPASQPAAPATTATTATSSSSPPPSSPRESPHGPGIAQVLTEKLKENVGYTATKSDSNVSPKGTPVEYPKVSKGGKRVTFGPTTTRTRIVVGNVEIVAVRGSEESKSESPRVTTESESFEARTAEVATEAPTATRKTKPRKPRCSCGGTRCGCNFENFCEQVGKNPERCSLALCYCANKNCECGKNYECQGQYTVRKEYVAKFRAELPVRYCKVGPGPTTKPAAPEKEACPCNLNGCGCKEKWACGFRTTEYARPSDGRRVTVCSNYEIARIDLGTPEREDEARKAAKEKRKKKREEEARKRAEEEERKKEAAAKKIAEMVTPKPEPPPRGTCCAASGGGTNCCGGEDCTCTYRSECGGAVHLSYVDRSVWHCDKYPVLGGRLGGKETGGTSGTGTAGKGGITAGPKAGAETGPGTEKSGKKSAGEGGLLPPIPKAPPVKKAACCNEPGGECCGGEDCTCSAREECAGVVHLDYGDRSVWHCQRLPGFGGGREGTRGKKKSAGGGVTTGREGTKGTGAGPTSRPVSGKTAKPGTAGTSGEGAGGVAVPVGGGRGKGKWKGGVKPAAAQPTGKNPCTCIGSNCTCSAQGQCPGPIHINYGTYSRWYCQGSPFPQPGGSSGKPVVSRRGGKKGKEKAGGRRSGPAKKDGCCGPNGTGKNCCGGKDCTCSDRSECYGPTDTTWRCTRKTTFGGGTGRSPKPRPSGSTGTDAGPVAGRQAGSKKKDGCCGPNGTGKNCCGGKDCTCSDRSECYGPTDTTWRCTRKTTFGGGTGRSSKPRTSGSTGTDAGPVSPGSSATQPSGDETPCGCGGKECSCTNRADCLGIVDTTWLCTPKVRFDLSGGRRKTSSGGEATGEQASGGEAVTQGAGKEGSVTGAPPPNRPSRRKNTGKSPIGKETPAREGSAKKVAKKKKPDPYNKFVEKVAGTTASPLAPLLAGMEKIYGKTWIEMVTKDYQAKEGRKSAIDFLVYLYEYLPIGQQSNNASRRRARLTLIEILGRIARDPALLKLWGDETDRLAGRMLLKQIEKLRSELKEDIRWSKGEKKREAQWTLLHLLVERLAAVEAGKRPAVEKDIRALLAELKRSDEKVIGKADEAGRRRAAERERALLALLKRLAAHSGSVSKSLVKEIQEQLAETYEKAAAAEPMGSGRRPEFYLKAAKIHLALKNFRQALSDAQFAENFSSGSENAYTVNLIKSFVYRYLLENYDRLSSGEKKSFFLVNGPERDKASLKKLVAEADEKVIQHGTGGEKEEGAVIAALVRRIDALVAEGKAKEALDEMENLEPDYGTNSIFLARYLLLLMQSDPKIRNPHLLEKALRESVKEGAVGKETLEYYKKKKREIVILMGSLLPRQRFSADEIIRIFNSVDVMLAKMRSEAKTREEKDVIISAQLEFARDYLRWIRAHPGVKTEELEKEFDRVASNAVTEARWLSPAAKVQAKAVVDEIKQISGGDERSRETRREIERGEIRDYRKLFTIFLGAMKSGDFETAKAAAERLAKSSDLSASKKIGTLSAILKWIDAVRTSVGLNADQKAFLDPLAEKLAKKIRQIVTGEIKEAQENLYEASKKMGTLSGDLSEKENREAYAAAAAKRAEALRKLRHLEATLLDLKLRGLSGPALKRALKAEIKKQNAEIKKQIDQLINLYGPAGEAVEEKANREGIQQFLAGINLVRARRDAAMDLLIARFPKIGYEENALRAGLSRRDQAIRDVFDALNGRRGRDGTRRGGAVGHLTYNQGWARYAEDEEGKKARYAWIEVYRDEIAYLKQRRKDLIFENPKLDASEKVAKYRKEIQAEADYWKKFGEKLSSAVFSDLTGVGAKEKAFGKEIEERLRVQEMPALVDQIVASADKNDPQKFFGLLVDLYNEKMRVSNEKYLEYIKTPKWRRGLAQVYYLYYSDYIGSSKWSYREVLKRIQAEGSAIHRLNLALIEASAKPVSSLSTEHRTLLEKKGFIVNGKYVIPKKFKFNPLTEGDAASRRSWVDKYVNVGSMVEALATVVVPGGLAASQAEKMFGKVALREGLKQWIKGGAKLATEAALFTGYSRVGQVLINPTVVLNNEFWSASALLKEYGHTIVMLGALKTIGGVTEKVGERVTKAVAPEFTAEEILSMPLSDLPKVGLKDHAYFVASSVTKFAVEGTSFAGLETMMNGQEFSTEGVLKSLVFLAELKAGGVLGRLGTVKREGRARIAAKEHEARTVEKILNENRRELEKIAEKAKEAEKRGGAGKEETLREVEKMKQKVNDYIASELLIALGYEVPGYPVPASASKEKKKITSAEAESSRAPPEKKATAGTEEKKSESKEKSEKGEKIREKETVAVVEEPGEKTVEKTGEREVAAKTEETGKKVGEASGEKKGEREEKEKEEGVEKEIVDVEGITGEQLGKGGFGEVFRNKENPNEVVKKIWVPLEKASTKADLQKAQAAVMESLYRELLGSRLLKAAGLEHAQITGQGITTYNHPEFGPVKAPVLTKPFVGEGMKVNGKPVHEAHILKDWMKENGYHDGFEVTKELPAEMQEMIVDYIHKALRAGLFLTDIKPGNIYIYKTSPEGPWRMGLIESDGVYRIKDYPELFMVDPTASPEVQVQQAAMAAFFSTHAPMSLVAGDVALAHTPQGLKGTLDGAHQKKLREYTPDPKEVDHSKINAFDMNPEHVLDPKLAELYRKAVVEKELVPGGEAAPKEARAPPAKVPGKAAEKEPTAGGGEEKSVGEREEKPKEKAAGKEEPAVVEVTEDMLGELVGQGTFGKVYKRSGKPGEVVKIIEGGVKGQMLDEFAWNALEQALASAKREIEGAKLLEAAGLAHIDVKAQGSLKYVHETIGEVVLPVLVKDFIEPGMRVNGHTVVDAVILEKWMVENGYRDKEGPNGKNTKPLPEQLQQAIIDYIRAANEAGLFLGDLKPDNFFLYKTSKSGEWKVGLLETDAVYRVADYEAKFVFQPGMSLAEKVKTLGEYQRFQGTMLMPAVQELPAYSFGGLRGIFDFSKMGEFGNFGSGKELSWEKVAAVDLSAERILGGDLLKEYRRVVEEGDRTPRTPEEPGQARAPPEPKEEGAEKKASEKEKAPAEGTRTRISGEGVTRTAPRRGSVPKQDLPPGFEPLDAREIAVISNKAGFRADHILSMRKAAIEEQVWLIVRNSNPAGRKYIGKKGYLPKPMAVKAKTADRGTLAGLVVNPYKRPEMFTEKRLKKARETWDKYVEDMRRAGYKVDAEDGIVRAPTGEKLHGDYDLHGVFTYSGEIIQFGSGEAKDEMRGLRWRMKLNEAIDPEHPMILHGGQDNWAKAPAPDPPVTVFAPDGRIVELKTAEEMKAFYEEQGLDWPYSKEPPKVRGPPEVPSLSGAEIQSISEKAGFRADHIHGMRKYAVEKKQYLVVRNSNARSRKFLGKEGFAPKPMTCKAKTADAGRLAGLVVNPYTRPEAFTSKRLKKARETWDKYVGDMKKAGFIVDAKDGIVRDKYGNKIHGDYDLHGVFTADGKLLQFGTGEAKDEMKGLSWRLRLNASVDPENPMVLHGGQDNWSKATAPDPPVTVFTPEGEVIHLDTVQQMKKFYKAHGLEWRYD
ncbi:MAG: hypothetical protein D6679_06810, partial [Candidatus Hydrogenedentota bacterium]